MRGNPWNLPSFKQTTGGDSTGQIKRNTIYFIDVKLCMKCTVSYRLHSELPLSPLGQEGYGFYSCGICIINNLTVKGTNNYHLASAFIYVWLSNPLNNKLPDTFVLQWFQVWIKKNEITFAWLTPTSAPGAHTHFMTSLFKHTFHKSRSVLQGPVLQEIYISIKKNGFMALLALGQSGEIHTDTKLLLFFYPHGIFYKLIPAD